MRTNHRQLVAGDGGAALGNRTAQVGKRLRQCFVRICVFNRRIEPGDLRVGQKIAHQVLHPRRGALQEFREFSGFTFDHSSQPAGEELGVDLYRP